MLHDWAIAFLQERFPGPHHLDPRELARLGKGEAPFKELKQAFRCVRVTYKSDRLEKRKIRGLLLRAGCFEFQLDNKSRTTVQASAACYLHKLTNIPYRILRITSGPAVSISITLFFSEHFSMIRSES
jgi:hypothetical protein